MPLVLRGTAAGIVTAPSEATGPEFAVVGPLLTAGALFFRLEGVFLGFGTCDLSESEN